jgi:hypothetical protein
LFEVAAQAGFPDGIEAEWIHEPSVLNTVLVASHVRIGLVTFDVAVARNGPAMLAIVTFSRHVAFGFGHRVALSS